MRPRRARRPCARKLDCRVRTRKGGEGEEKGWSRGRRIRRHRLCMTRRSVAIRKTRWLLATNMDVLLLRCPTSASVIYLYTRSVLYMIYSYNRLGERWACVPSYCITWAPGIHSTMGLEPRDDGIPQGKVQDGNSRLCVRWLRPNLRANKEVKPSNSRITMGLLFTALLPWIWMQDNMEDMVMDGRECRYI